MLMIPVLVHIGWEIGCSDFVPCEWARPCHHSSYCRGLLLRVIEYSSVSMARYGQEVKGIVHDHGERLLRFKAGK